MRGPLAAAAALTIALTGCSSGSAPSAPRTTTATQGAAAVRWWTARDYCGILRQTVHAGHSILPDAAAGDPAVLASARRFTATLTAAAPPAVRPQWRTVSSTLVTLVRSGGKAPALSAADARRVAQAASAIAADAQSRCSLTLGSS